MSTRERILDAAAKLVRQGSALTVSAAAKAAGVSRGTVYRHFDDLATLARALETSERIDARLGRSIEPAERILDAVTALLTRSGMSAMTIEAVAEAAKVSPMTVYRHFGDRRGLLRAFVEQRTPRRLAAELPAASTGDVEADLRHIALVCLRFFEQHRSLLLMAFSANPEEMETFAEIRRSSTSMRSIVARVIESQLPGAGELEARAFLGLVMAMGWEPDGLSVEERADRAVAIFLHGVRDAR